MWSTDSCISIQHDSQVITPILMTIVMMRDTARYALGLGGDSLLGGLLFIERRRTYTAAILTVTISNMRLVPPLTTNGPVFCGLTAQVNLEHEIAIENHVWTRNIETRLVIVELL